MMMIRIRQTEIEQIIHWNLFLSQTQDATSEANKAFIHLNSRVSVLLI